MKKKLFFSQFVSLSVVTLGISLVGNFFNFADAIPVKNVSVSFANAGGDFTTRQASFQVPEKQTTTVVQDGLRLYDLHIAKMIELTNYFCNEGEARKGDYIVYWNYEAEGGKVFMGKYSMTCQFAKDTIAKFGTVAKETMAIDFAGNPQTAKVSALNLNNKNSKDFTKLVQTLKPECIEVTPKICPGDRLE